MKALLNALFRAYHLILSPLLGTNCRYAPTCSVYTRVAIDLHGPVKGSWLGLKRICRCHPLGGHGFDPVPGSPEANNPAYTSDHKPKETNKNTSNTHNQNKD